MSDDLDRLPPEEEQDIRAAEYVIGLLSPAEARAVEALALHDPVMGASIAGWEARLGPLSGLVEPVTPPPVLWQRLALAAGLDVLPRTPLAPRVPRSGGALLWKAATAAALALAAAFGGLLLQKPAVTPQPAPLLAALSPYGSPGATFLVRVGPDGNATVVAVGDAAVPAGRALQLWAVAGSAAPVSLGLLPASGRATLAAPIQAGTQLLVSQEPAGGSPQAGPTGPVVYAGRLTGL